MRYYSSTAVEMALTGAVNEVALTFVVDTTLGLPAQTPFTLVVDVGLSTEEIVTVTGVSGMNLTVTRGEDNSTAIAHTAGAIVRHMMTARDLREPAVHVDATANVHGIGATASVVGTDTAQTLTNKTVNFADNTITGVPQAAVTDLVDDIAALELADHNPIGTVLMWAGGATAPTGYLIAAGAAISRTTYSALFAVIGTMYGVGDGVSTFNLPALPGRVIVGFDATQTEFDTMGEAGGEKTHLLTTAEMPSHTHYKAISGFSDPGTEYADDSYYPRVSGSNPQAGALSTAAAGGGGAHNNLQPYIVLRYIVKF